MYLKKIIMIIIYKQKLRKIAFWLLFAMMAGVMGCKKGTFDINGTNPNSLAPNSVTAKYYLTSTLAATANVMYTGGNGAFYGPDLINTWMGYWSASGGYTPSPIVVLYQLTNGVGTGNWDDAYLNIKNYTIMESLSAADSTQTEYGAISLIMQAFMYQRIVDLYNNAPFVQAFDINNKTPSYDDGSFIYTTNIKHIDSAIGLIHAAQSFTENPGKYDVMFGGDTAKWVKFANTLKLKMLMRLTQFSGGPAIITPELGGLTTDNFLGEGEDALVNPGYSTAANTQENPLFLDIAQTVTGSPGTNNVYWRANNYAVNFYTNNNDPRLEYFYVPAQTTGTVVGRDIGSTSGTEGNGNVSAVNGPGVAKGADQSAVIIGAFESLFLQAEAVQRGYLTGDAAALYKSAVEQSFVLLGVTDAVSSADTYIAQANNANVNYETSANKLKTLIIQKWAACNTIDPLESYSDWRRLGIPTDLVVSNYPGSQASHIPYRLVYPTSETSYNSAAVEAQGTVDALTSKVFWQP
jgi:Starch-binding associating with outer membrane